MTDLTMCSQRRIWGRLWNFGTLGEKIHRVFEALVGCFVGAWEMNVESSADDGDLACEVSEGN